MSKVNKEIEAAWQYNGSLFLSMPSSRGGVYIVRVTPVFNGIEIAHSCPAVAWDCPEKEPKCWHQNLALQAYREWRWWEMPEPQEVFYRREAIVLQSHWKQIQVPGIIPPELEAILNEYTSKHH